MSGAFPQRKRFIPAYAGNTVHLGAINIPCEIHPRVCGEYVNMGMVFWRGRDSSPRMRGILNIDISYFGFCRFTPAYAGNTLKKRPNYIISSVMVPQKISALFWCVFENELDLHSAILNPGDLKSRIKAGPLLRFEPGYFCGRS